MSLKPFSQCTVAFLREAGAAVTFFASFFCVKAKNEVGFGAKPHFNNYLGQ